MQDLVIDPAAVIAGVGRPKGGRRLMRCNNKNISELPLITIITVTYNAAEDFQRTANSIREQTYKNVEWIVIDGKSIDSTVDVIRKNQDVIDYWISEPDKGIADAWNKGLALASGCGVLMLNAGDVYTKDAVALLARNYHPRKIVCASANLISKDNQIIGVFKSRPWKLSHGMHVAHNWCLVPTSFYRELGGYPEYKYSMDFAWFHKYYRKYKNDGFIVLNEVLGNYSLGGISDEHSSEGFKNNANIIISVGGSRFIAWPICIAYMVRHRVFRYWRNR